MRCYNAGPGGGVGTGIDGGSPLATGALFIGWGPTVRGREQQALPVFNETVRYVAGLQQRGEIAGFEPVALEPHGGDLCGFLLVRGDGEALARLRAGEGFVGVIQRGPWWSSAWGSPRPTPATPSPGCSPPSGSWRPSWPGSAPLPLGDATISPRGDRRQSGGACRTNRIG